MAKYLDWIEANYAPGFVSAKGGSYLVSNRVVKRTFQVMLAAGPFVSLVLLAEAARQNPECVASTGVGVDPVSRTP